MIIENSNKTFIELEIDVLSLVRSIKPSAGYQVQSYLEENKSTNNVLLMQYSGSKGSLV